MISLVSLTLIKAFGFYSSTHNGGFFFFFFFKYFFYLTKRKKVSDKIKGGLKGVVLYLYIYIKK